MTQSKDTAAVNGGGRITLDGFARALVIAAALCIVAASLRAVQNVLAPLVAAMFFSLVVTTPVPWLAKRLPRWLAVLLVAVATVGFIGLVVALTPRWISTLVALFDDHSSAMETSMDQLRDLLTWLGLGAQALDMGDGISGEWLLDASARAFRLVSGTILVLVLLGFVVSELAGFRTKVEAALGPASNYLALLDRVYDRLTGYFFIKTIASAITGILVCIACAVAGLPVPELWGLLAFLLNFAPTIGSFVAAVPAVLLAFVMLEWWQATLLAGVYLVVNITIGSVIEPKILGERMGLSPLVVLISLVVWGWILGPIGLLLAVPLTMLCKLVLEQTTGLKAIAVLLGGLGEARRSVQRRRREEARKAPLETQTPR